MIKEDFLLKIKCLDLAGREQLEMYGMIKSKELIDRAKDLYTLTKIDIDEWGILTKPKKNVSKGKKICPGCGEEIPISFKIHKYTSKGVKCGTIF